VSQQTAGNPEAPSPPAPGTVTLRIPHPATFIRNNTWLIVVLALAVGHYGGPIFTAIESRLPHISFGSRDNGAWNGPLPDPNATDPPTVGVTLREYVCAGYADAIEAAAQASVAGKFPSDVIAAASAKFPTSMATPSQYLGQVLNKVIGTSNAALDANSAAKLQSFLRGLGPTLHPAAPSKK
jgi:hypothetical protein